MPFLRCQIRLERSDRKALSDEVALKELRDCSGTQFDPVLTQAFLTLYESYPDSIRSHVEDLTREVGAIQNS